MAERIERAAKRSIDLVAVAIARKRLRELRGGGRWEVNYCGFERLDAQFSALVIALSSLSLAEIATDSLEQMVIDGLRVVGIGKSEGGPLDGYPRVTVLVVRSWSITPKMRRRFGSLNRFGQCGII